MRDDSLRSLVRVLVVLIIVVACLVVLFKLLSLL